MLQKIFKQSDIRDRRDRLRADIEQLISEEKTAKERKAEALNARDLGRPDADRDVEHAERLQQKIEKLLSDKRIVLDRVETELVATIENERLEDVRRSWRTVAEKGATVWSLSKALEEGLTEVILNLDQILSLSSEIMSIVPETDGSALMSQEELLESFKLELRRQGLKWARAWNHDDNRIPRFSDQVQALVDWTLKYGPKS